MNTIRRTLATTLLLAVVAIAMSVSWAAAPPVWVNYQGVLRDDGNNPLDGTYDMVFRFYSGLDEEILIDRHTAAQGGAITVSGGLFNVSLGTGTTADGSGPGSYGSLAEVFRDYSEVHLEVQIGADGAPGTEVLTPRTRVMSSAYALNASNLAGLPATSLMRSDESDTYTFGTLTFYPATTLDVDGALHMDGAVTKATTGHVANFNADLLDNMDSSAFAAAAHGHTGAEIVGPVGEAGNADLLDGFDSGYFLNSSTEAQIKHGTLSILTGGVSFTALAVTGDSLGADFTTANGTGRASVASGDLGIEGVGTEAGGHFLESDAGTEAWLAGGGYGVEGYGPSAGGYFRTQSGSGYARVGYLDEGISAHGTVQGGFFMDDDSTGEAHLAYGDTGIQAFGSSAGGYFGNRADTSSAYAASGGYGVVGYGDLVGGYFEDQVNGGKAYVGYGNWGIEASGRNGGGLFIDTDNTSSAGVAYGDYGIKGYGALAGGYFESNNGSGRADVGYGHYGIMGYGDSAGGFFQDTAGSAYAYLGWPNWGVTGHGTTAGGFFEGTGHSGYAYVGYADRGIWGRGNFAGGTFSYPDDVTIWADVAKWEPSGMHYTITGNGQKNFVQNHPADPSKIVVYASLEGDEVGTYTRGIARLVAGEARVALGETFKWVTHPDVGLTAQVTPRSADAVVYVESITTEELVVRNVSGFPDDAAFDFIVHGLRIGFESSTAVRDKDREAPIPDDGLTQEFYAQRPELRTYTPLARFTKMAAEVEGVSPDDIDLTGAAALKTAIVAAGSQGIGKSEDERPAPDAPSEAVPPVGESLPLSVLVGPTAAPDESPEGRVAAPSPYPTFPMAGPVEPGDLLVLDPERPGQLRLANFAADPTVVGIVAGELAAGEDGAVAPVAGTGFVVVKVDASYGEIRPGDLLTSSFTPGHAMRAGEVVPGTIIGKALEPLSTGTGLIKVLVMPR